SSTTTDFPADARRYAATEPPNPEPTTTTSARSLSVPISAPVPLQEGEDVREHVQVGVAADHRVDVAVPGDDLQLVAAGHQPVENPVADDVGVGEDVVLVAGQEQHRRLDALRTGQVVVGEIPVRRVARVELHAVPGPHDLPDVPVVVDVRRAVEVGEPL